MKYVLQFCRILAFCFAGEALHFLLPLPVPASIYGLLLLLAALRVVLVRLEQVRETGQFLIAIFPLLFIPAAVVILTGIVGNLLAGSVCRWFGITDPMAKGMGIGTAAHAIGTTKALEMGATEGTVSSLAIAVAGVLTALLTPFLQACSRFEPSTSTRKAAASAHEAAALSVLPSVWRRGYAPSFASSR